VYSFGRSVRSTVDGPQPKAAPYVDVNKSLVEARRPIEIMCGGWFGK